MSMKEGTNEMDVKKAAMPLWLICLLSVVIAGTAYVVFDMAMIGNVFYLRAIVAVIVHQIAFWVIYRILKRKGTDQKKLLILLLTLPAAILIIFCIVSYVIFLVLLGKELTM